METFHLMLYFEFECFGQFVFLTREDGLLDGANSDLRTIRDFPCKGMHFGLEAISGNDVVDEAQAVRRESVDHFTGVEHFRGNGGAYKFRKKVGAAEIGEKAYLGKILAEDRAIQGDTNIAGERKIHACTCSRTIHRSDNRLGNGSKLQNCLHARAKKRGKLFRVVAFAALANISEVAAGTEGTARSGQNNDVNREVGGNAAQGVVERAGQVVVERVEPVRAIHGQRDNGSIPFFQQDGGGGLGYLAHGLTLGKVLL